MWRNAAIGLAAWAWLFASHGQGQNTLRVAFAEVDITPDLSRPVWIAGYEHGRRATGVHDPLMARGLVLDDGAHKMAFVCVDLIGLQYPAVKRIRQRLPQLDYCMVSSTHNHEGPDVIGIWGATPFQSGVDDAYVDLVVTRVVELVGECEKSLAPARARYGTAQDDTLLDDSRLPKVYDGVLRVIRFDPAGELTEAGTGRPLGLLVQWNCHPESLGSRNKLLTADFPYATVARLKEQFKCPVAYFSGAVGGLMAPPDNRVKNSQGELLPEGDYEYARVYGEEVAALAEQAVAAAQPLRLTPLEAFARPIAVPLANPLYQAARALGVLRRDGLAWTGDFEQLGSLLTSHSSKATTAVETEVAYLRLGELHVACIPGELYPELVYGEFPEPAEAHVDFPEAPLETPVMKLLPGEKTLLFGLANDEIGYIIPKRQWDNKSPFAYGRKSPQYGEVNSCGPEIAPILMQALQNRVKEAQSKRKPDLPRENHDASF